METTQYKHNNASMKSRCNANASNTPIQKRQQPTCCRERNRVARGAGQQQCPQADKKPPCQCALQCSESVDVHWPKESDTACPRGQAAKVGAKRFCDGLTGVNHCSPLRSLETRRGGQRVSIAQRET